MNRDIPEDKRRELSHLIRQNRYIDAIKLYREITGLGLKEAKDAVDAFEISAADFLPSGSLDFPAERATRESDLTSSQHASINELLRQGRKIEAIKIYREATGLGLKEAKDAVEAMEGTVPAPVGLAPQSHRDPFAEKKKGCIGMVAVLIAAALLLAVLSALL